MCECIVTDVPRRGRCSSRARVRRRIGIRREKKFPAAFVVAVAVVPSALVKVTTAPTEGRSAFASSKTVPAMLNAAGSPLAPSWQTRQGCPGRWSGPRGTPGVSPPSAATASSCTGLQEPAPRTAANATSPTARFIAPPRPTARRRPKSDRSGKCRRGSAYRPPRPRARRSTSSARPPARRRRERSPRPRTLMSGPSSRSPVR